MSNYSLKNQEFLEKLQVFASQNSLSARVSLTDFEPFKNRLEAIALFVSHMDQKSYDLFLSRLLDLTDPVQARDLDFIIFVNRDSFDLKPDTLKPLFKSVTIRNLNISTDQDLYVRTGSPIPAQLPPLGARSGPNTVFFGAMSELTGKNTTLILETDCYLGKDWLSRLKQYCQADSPFWISGATYDGPNPLVDFPGLATHINGVALYATGHPQFQLFLNSFREFLIRFIKIKSDLPYDHGIRLFVDGNLASGKDLALWRFIDRLIVRNNLVFNFSRSQDSYLDPQTIFERHNYAILHKKDPSLAGCLLSPPPLEKFPLFPTSGFLDCYTDEKHIYFDLNPAMWIEKTDEEILAALSEFPLKNFSFVGATVKRTVQYQAAIFLRLKRPSAIKLPTLLLGNDRFPVKPIDSRKVFLQIAAVVSNIAEAQSIIERWEKSHVQPNRFVFYFLSSFFGSNEDTLSSRCSLIITHLWALPKMHSVKNEKIFKSDQRLEHLCININSAYSHCLKFHRGATWTLFVTPNDELLSIQETSELSLAQSLKKIPDNTNVLNLPIHLYPPKEKLLHLPVFRTASHHYTACLNWAYSPEREQATSREFKVSRRDPVAKPLLFIQFSPGQRAQSIVSSSAIIKKATDQEDFVTLQNGANELGDPGPMDIVLTVSDQVKKVNPHLYRKVLNSFSEFFPKLDGVIAFRDPNRLSKFTVCVGREFIKSRGSLFDNRFKSNFWEEDLLLAAQERGKLVFVKDHLMTYESPSLDWDSFFLNSIIHASYDRFLLREKYSATHGTSVSELERIVIKSGGPFGLTQLKLDDLASIVKENGQTAGNLNLPDFVHSFSEGAKKMFWSKSQMRELVRLTGADIHWDHSEFSHLSIKLLILLFCGGSWEEKPRSESSNFPGAWIKSKMKRGSRRSYKVLAALPGNPLIGYFLGELGRSKKKLSCLGTSDEMETFLIEKFLKRFKELA